MNFKKLFFYNFTFFILCQNYFICAKNNFDQTYIESFIKHYDFTQGRYSHEYHPALLQKTVNSLEKLEKSLINNNFNIKGRFIICGYEEQAIPSYYTDYKKAKINDEASSKNNIGWSLKLHNIFGLATGFLFKNFNYFNNQWFKNKKSKFQHIDSDYIEIFDENADIFQQHAFGQAFPLMCNTELEIIKYFKEDNFNGLFNTLIKFWLNLYNGKIQVANAKIAGTQDIIFSIEYAKHLMSSSLPLYKFYTGPDITYPIEVSVSQEKNATLHAQHFIKKFSKNIKPIDDKPTAYIFCSFVDGVGKSTLLGNTKNYLKYGKKIKSYERVDNSSSQFANIFKFKENSFIVDLPAQVSHFTYKPDGLVYVDIKKELEKKTIKNLQKIVIKNKTKLKDKYNTLLKEIKSVINFANENKKNLKQEYNTLITEVKNTINSNGYFASSINNSSMPEKIFIKNLILIKKEKINRWIPVKYNNKNYLFNYYNPTEIRILVPLQNVQSEGLKNIETEQMLFINGVNPPLEYKFFLNDLKTKLQKNNIQNVVFVDFISMYPRSCRENIRINYLLQQFSLLDSKFNLQQSLYRNFTSEAEFYALLENKDIFEKILNSFRLETLVRLALFKIIINSNQQTLHGLKLPILTNLIKNEFQKISNEDLSLLNKLSFNKLMEEKKRLAKIYGLTKNFINIQKFSFKPLIKFSNLLSDFFTSYVENYNLKLLWQKPTLITSNNSNKDNCFFNQIVKTNNGEKVFASYLFSSECKEEQLLAPFIRNLKTSWYASIVNLLNAKLINDQFLTLKKEKFKIIPKFLTQGIDEKIYLIQRLFYQWKNDIPKSYFIFENLFNLRKVENPNIVNLENNPYILDYENISTNHGLFSFGLKANKQRNKSILTFLVQKYQKKYGLNKVITTKKLYKLISKSALWKREQKNLIKKAKKNGPNKKNNKNKLNGKYRTFNTPYIQHNFKMKKKSKKIFLGSQEQIPNIQLMLRLLATVEMILKDPESDIVVRFGNRKDFKAAIKLLEKITLPNYFGLIFKNYIFDNYNEIEPYPSWDFWDNLV